MAGGCAFGLAVFCATVALVLSITFNSLGIDMIRKSSLPGDVEIADGLQWQSCRGSFIGILVVLLVLHLLGVVIAVLCQDDHGGRTLSEAEEEAMTDLLMRRLVIFWTPALLFAFIFVFLKYDVAFTFDSRDEYMAAIAPDCGISDAPFCPKSESGQVFYLQGNCTQDDRKYWTCGDGIRFGQCAAASCPCVAAETCHACQTSNCDSLGGKYKTLRNVGIANAVFFSQFVLYAVLGCVCSCGDRDHFRLI